MLGKTNVASSGGSQQSQKRTESLNLDFNSIKISKALAFGGFASGMILPDGNSFELHFTDFSDISYIPQLTYEE